MATSNTIPSSHTQLPALPPAASSLPTKTTKAERLARAKVTAASKLKQKNRKHHTLQITTLLDLTVEAGNNYTMSGFSPDIDEGAWTVGEVVHSVTGKQASTTKIHLYRPPQVS